MNNKLVSIILPVYNAEKYFKNCIESILLQTYKNIELIIVNDGSTDKTGDICDLFAKKEKRIKIIHQANSGPSAARNTGILMARGGYIQFVDSDDYLDSQMTEQLVEQFEKKIDLVICGYIRVNYDKKGNKKLLKSKLYNEVAISKKELLEKFGELFQDYYINYPWNKLYRTDIIKNNNIKFDNSIKWGEDLIFNLQYLGFCKMISIINSRLYNYVENSESITSSYNKNLFNNQQYMYKEVEKFLTLNNAFRGENKVIFEKKFTNAIVMSLEHLFHHKDKISSTSLKSKIKEIINDPAVLKHKQNINSTGLQNKIIGLLIRKKSISGILLYFKLKNLIREDFSFIFRHIKKFV